MLEKNNNLKLLSYSIYMENQPRLCKLCGKKLRKFRISHEYHNRVYHKKCFEEICNDVKNFHLVAFTKYGHEKRYDGKTKDEMKKDPNPLIVTFD